MHPAPTSTEPRSCRQRHLPHRVPDFAFDAETPPIWTPLHPELACIANAVSLMMPHVEPLIVRTVRAATRELGDEAPNSSSAYALQELEHQRQHRRWNRVVTAHYPSLRRVDRLIRWWYRMIGRRGGLGAQVAFAAGSESVAYAVARWVERHADELFAQADPAVAALFVWHLAEEVEHKSAAHDLFVATGWRRTQLWFATLAAVVSLAGLTVIGATPMLLRTRRLLSPAGWWTLARWSLSFAFSELPNIAASLRRDHHPGQFVDPGWYATWLATSGFAQDPVRSAQLEREAPGTADLAG